MKKMVALAIIIGSMSFYVFGQQRTHIHLPKYINRPVPVTPIIKPYHGNTSDNVVGYLVVPACTRPNCCYNRSTKK